MRRPTSGPPIGSFRAKTSSVGTSLKLSDVAERASVSRQAIYLHFGDRSGLLVALVQHMDEQLNLTESLGAVTAASDGGSVLEAAMRLNTTFWAQVLPVA
ncbi:MAG: TetR/AcrR family transcriptional regulator, partial [Acidimicrobiia bacterium]|nr:TetR/AcrR family transcriptional regulator [Acidimicrobiia bacterium]